MYASLILNVSIHKVQGRVLSGRTVSVYGAAGRCEVFRGRDVQYNDDDMRDLSRQMV